MRPAPVLLVCLSLASPVQGARAPAQGRGAPPTFGVTIADWSPRPIREIYISPSTADDWGPERLGGRQVRAGDDVFLLYGGGCQADLRVVFDNGGAEERHDLDLCRDTFIGVRPGWTTGDDLAGTMPRGLVLVRNRSGRTIARLYLFADGEGTGGDRLGTEVLPDRLDVDLLLPPAPRCDLSLQAGFLGETDETRYSGIDLCRSHEITIGPRTTAR